MGGEDADRNKDNSWVSPNRPYQEKEGDSVNFRRVLIFGLIGATATTLALSHSPWKGRTGGSFWSAFREESWKRYNRRMQEEYEEEMERVERIRRMQNVFNRERSKFKRGNESWNQNEGYNQNFQRDDWYWKTNASFRNQGTNFNRASIDTASYPLSHHYSVLGLDRSRSTPYTEAEIKTAFRAKAKEFHPDQNKDNREVAEAKFKEVMVSYEAIKHERESMK